MTAMKPNFSATDTGCRLTAHLDPHAHAHGEPTMGALHRRCAIALALLELQRRGAELDAVPGLQQLAVLDPRRPLT